MIQMETVLRLGDNSGAKEVKCIKVLGGSHRVIAGIGDVIVVSVQNAIPYCKVKKGEIYKAVIIRTKSNIVRSDGSWISFDDNVVALLNKQGEPLGTRILGPVPRELRDKNFIKIVSLASEVL